MTSLLSIYRVTIGSLALRGAMNREEGAFYELLCNVLMTPNIVLILVLSSLIILACRTRSSAG